MLAETRNVACIDGNLLAQLKSEVRKGKALRVKFVEMLAQARTARKYPTMQKIGNMLQDEQRLCADMDNGAEDGPLHVWREQHTRAVAWEERLRQTGIEKGAASIDDLRQLALEARELLVTLNNRQIVEDATKPYCLCRRPMEGDMLQCDWCKEWLHNNCDGIVGPPGEYYCCLCCRIHLTAAFSRRVSRQYRTFFSHPSSSSACAVEVGIGLEFFRKVQRRQGLRKSNAQGSQSGLRRSAFSSMRMWTEN